MALLDRLQAQRAVLAGTSLGANIALEVADAAPLLEMPVLDNALEAGGGPAHPSRGCEEGHWVHGAVP